MAKPIVRDMYVWDLKSLKAVLIAQYHSCQLTRWKILI